MREIEYEATLPRIRIRRSDLDELLELGRRSRGVFGCNDRCEVWLALRRGHIPPAERQYVDHPVLDEIAEAITVASPGGGRFRVTEEGVYLMRTGEQLFAFEVLSQQAP